MTHGCNISNTNRFCEHSKGLLVMPWPSGKHFPFVSFSPKLKQKHSVSQRLYLNFSYSSPSLLLILSLLTFLFVSTLPTKHPATICSPFAFILFFKETLPSPPPVKSYGFTLADRGSSMPIMSLKDNLLDTNNLRSSPISYKCSLNKSQNLF